MAPIVSGTIAAVVPMDCPTRNLVNGISRTSRIRNGNERVMFTIAPITKFTPLFCKRRPFEVEYNITPRGIPTMYEKSEAKNVITNVSHTPVMIASFM